MVDTWWKETDNTANFTAARTIRIAKILFDWIPKTRTLKCQNWLQRLEEIAFEKGTPNERIANETGEWVMVGVRE